MHQHSEYGVAAHWRYKEGGAARRAATRASTTRSRGCGRCSTGRTRSPTPAKWLAAFKSSLFTDSIYVLTPQGKVVDLPQGSTPIDFAYAVHTSLGHRCRGAQRRRPDGAARLRAAQRPAGRDRRGQAGRPVARLAQPRPRLRAQPSRARQGAAVVQGAAARARPSRRAARWSSASSRASARPRSSSTRSRAKAGFAKTDDFFAAFARDEINSRQVQAAIRRVAQPAARRRGRRPSRRSSCGRAAPPAAGSGILVVGVDRLMTGLARCCKPAPPDPIVGFVTRGKGVTIHRASVRERRAHPRARARAPDRRRLGRAARRGVPGRHRRRGDGSPGIAARHLRNAVAREDQRHRGQHADAPASGADGVHARG